MKININDLTKEQLDEFCARAQRWRKETIPHPRGGACTVWRLGDDWIHCKDYSPTTNDAQAMALVKEFKLNTCYLSSGCWDVSSKHVVFIDENLNVAICRAVCYTMFDD